MIAAWPQVCSTDGHTHLKPRVITSAQLPPVCEPQFSQSLDLSPWGPVALSRLCCLIVMQDTQDRACVCNACMDPHAQMFAFPLQCHKSLGLVKLVQHVCKRLAAVHTKYLVLFLIHSLFCILLLCSHHSPHVVYKWFNEYIMSFSELSVQHGRGSMRALQRRLLWKCGSEDMQSLPVPIHRAHKQVGEKNPHLRTAVL